VAASTNKKEVARMANNEKEEGYETIGFSADEIEIPGEGELSNLDEVEPAITDMGDEEFIQMLAKNITEDIESEPASMPETISDLNFNPDKKESTQNVGLGNIIDLGEELSAGEEQKNIAEENGENLMASLDSIVQEIHEENFLDDALANPANTDFSEESQEDTFDDGLFLGEEMGGELEPEPEPEQKSKKEKPAKSEKKEKQKISFWDKIKSLFFRVEVVEPLSDEEEEEQRTQKKQQKEEKKRAAAATKKQKAAEKKEAAKKKKEEAAAKKAAKPKKEKKPKPPKEPEEVVHIKPMFLIFLVSVAVAMVLITITLSDTYGYQLAVREARNNLERNHYEEAFQALNGMKMNTSDEEFYESLRILMRVEKQYHSYVNYNSLNMPNEALDSLVKAVGNYDKYFDIAESYGIKEELDGLLSNVEYALNTGYGLDLTTVREWNTLDDSNEYTKKIMACTGSY